MGVYASLRKNGPLFLSILLPIMILYYVEQESFNLSWKGRAPYLFFLWLLFMEFIINRGKMSQGTLSWKRKVATVVLMAIPTVYVASTSFLGLADGVIQLGRLLNVPSGGRYSPRGVDIFLEYHWPLSLEFLVFTVSFVLTTTSLGGRGYFKSFLVSSFFLASISVFFTIDTFFPFGAFTALQQFAPVTASIAARVLESLGYVANVIPIPDGSVLRVQNAGGRRFLIAVYWPCAGIHSLVIYTFTLLLFLRGTTIPTVRKIAYFLVGAGGTFFVNILRITTISQLGIISGPAEAEKFHEFYGELYFLVWMLLYLVAVFAFEWAWAKLKSYPKMNEEERKEAEVSRSI